ncbi:MAG TPA: phosphoribosylformylglycinamidine synthase subunit PurL [Elusimicrobia bacterium]|nr:phosphoribosylformylglycinamidine synthase subunit PurL [Elusimicrobiota bacterium]
MELLLSKFSTLNHKQLAALDKKYGWSLNLLELEAAQRYFKKLKREPTRGELETIAQTWSEHCKHKTFSGPVKFRSGRKVKRYKNLFKETIVKATRRLNKQWCLSVFKDNAGVVEFGAGGKWALAFKAETHNHPCALEPYGGAETGVGGVVRDIMGVGLGAKPVLNTDIFCFGRLDSKMKLPKNALGARRIFDGVVEGVRDYGNRMGIPTAAGAVVFDDGYALNPLVFVGCAGIIPRDKIHKKVSPGELIVVIGGSTGRDGIHGATFSSANIAEDTSNSAVQIGHALNEKKALDVLLKARDKNLYSAVTDCGAGGFSSAIGELASECGAIVELEKAELKDTAIEPWEIWVSESQERMVFAVPPKNLKRLAEIADGENCGYCVLGRFTGDNKLRVTFKGESVVALDNAFLHGGIPNYEKNAVFLSPATCNLPPKKIKKPYHQVLKSILSHPNVCSRRSIVSQYDHEVQGGTVVKPFVGPGQNGPSDAAVIWPQAATGDMKDFSGFAAAHGINPAVGRINPYLMALYAADEAVRNLLCVGADITRTALLDNFCAGSPKDPQVMGGLVLAAEGCYAAAMGYGAPFISGKDSFYNQSTDAAGRQYPVPLTLLISAVAPVEDIRKSFSMNLKRPGNPIYLAGTARKGMGGSIYNELYPSGNNALSGLDIKDSFKLYKALLSAMRSGYVMAAHDISDGGFAAAAAEMAFGGDFGADLCPELCFAESGISETELLFGESPSRLLLEVDKKSESDFLSLVSSLQVAKAGYVNNRAELIIINARGKELVKEKNAGLLACWERDLL